MAESTPVVTDISSNHKYDEHRYLFTDCFESSYFTEDASTDIANIDEVFTGGLLTVGRASALYATFFEMSHYFPFVILPRDLDFVSVAHDRPFLCLAVLASVSSKEKCLQRALDENLRQALSRKVILQGEKSLDLLQGLILYLAW